MVDRSGTTTYTYSTRGETLEVGAPQGTVTSAFDAAGNRSSVSRGSGTTSFVYDNASRLSSLTNGFSETTGFTRDAAGRITRQDQANGTYVVATYATGSTGRGWLTAVEHKRSNHTTLARYEYTRGLTGHITNASQPSDHAVAYTYDNAYQLTQEVRTGTNAYNLQYAYDAVGNRTSKTAGGTTENYTYGDNNQLLTAGSKTYGYDNNGNLTSVTSGGQTTSLEWDYNNKLTKITYPNASINTFVTNDLGQRVSKTDSGGTITSLYDGDEVLADSRADYTNGGLTGLISEKAGTTSKVYHGDQLGSTRGMTNGSQVVTDSREYDSFGLTVASSGMNTPFGFAGGQGYRGDPDSGLMLLGARYYDASVGRFISRDPAGYAGGLNLYGYCNNNPVSLIDPGGCWPDKPRKDKWTLTGGREAYQQQYDSLKGKERQPGVQKRMKALKKEMDRHDKDEHDRRSGHKGGEQKPKKEKVEKATDAAPTPVPAEEDAKVADRVGPPAPDLKSVLVGAAVVVGVVVVVGAYVLTGPISIPVTAAVAGAFLLSGGRGDGGA